MFKVGDKVFHLSYGWGKILDLLSRDEWVKIKFKDNTYSFIGYDYISFTEYTLQGFRQERPIELPEVGELCLVRDSDAETWKVRSFLFESGGAFYIKARCGATDGYKQMKRIKILD